MPASRMGLVGKLSAPAWMTRTVQGDATTASALVHSVVARSVAATASRTSARIRASWSDRQAGRELNLAGRAGFTRGQPRPRDLPECRASNQVPWRTEIRTGEHIEHVDPELHSE